VKRPPGFLESETPNVAPGKARFEIIPAPYEKSVSYGRGTVNGPAALLEASQQLEAFDGRGIPAAAGIHTGPAVNCRGPAETVLARIEERAGDALEGGRIPIVLGGEHTVSLAPIRALAAFGKEFGVVQFDAHADLRDAYEGNPLSHASVMRRVAEDLGVPLFQIGCRAYCEEEATFRKKKQIPFLDAETLALEGIPKRLLPRDFPKKIYISFDVDAFDPAIMPGTGTPVPGGLFWYDALRLLRGTAAGRRIVGFDVVELAPLDGSPVSEFTAARLTYELMRLCLP
jgi:agmatinase